MRVFIKENAAEEPSAAADFPLSFFPGSKSSLRKGTTTDARAAQPPAENRVSSLITICLILPFPHSALIISHNCHRVNTCFQNFC